MLSNELLIRRFITRGGTLLILHEKTDKKTGSITLLCMVRLRQILFALFVSALVKDTEVTRVCVCVFVLTRVLLGWVGGGIISDKRWLPPKNGYNEPERNSTFGFSDLVKEKLYRLFVNEVFG